MPVFWDGGSPSESRIAIQVFWVPPGPPVFVRFLAALDNVWTHWVERGNRPCMGQDCPHCAAGLAQRWRGFAPALLWREAWPDQPPLPGAPWKKIGQWISIVFDAPEGVAELLEGDLRGRIFEFWRRGKRRNAPLDGKELERAAIAQLPPAFPVRPIVERLWGIRPRALPAAVDGIKPTLKLRTEGGAG